MASIQRQIEHMWKYQNPSAPDPNRIENTTSKAYKQRRKELMERNRRIEKATWHIERHALIAYARAATVLNQCRKELLAGEMETAMELFERACELSARISNELEIVGLHLQVPKEEMPE